MNFIRRTTSFLALMMMVIALLGEQPIKFCLGCVGVGTTQHFCCDENPTLTAATVSSNSPSSPGARAASSCVSCTQIAFRLQAGPVGKAGVEFSPEYAPERFVPAAVVPRVIASSIHPVENHNSPPRFLRTVQLLI